MSSELRVMSLDARLLRHDPAGVRAAVTAAAPDVVGVSGAPRYLRWRSKRAALARRLGMVVATADRPGGMFIMTSLRAKVLDRSFAMTSSSAATSPAVVSATIELRGCRWHVVVAAPGGAPGIPAADAPYVVVGGPGTIGISPSLTVISCDPVDVPGVSGERPPMLAVVQQ